MANTMAHKVSRLTLKPIRYRPKKVPISATGIAMAGIKVERKSCKKIYTTKNTSTNASSKVFNTSWIESNKKSLAFNNSTTLTPGGKVGSTFLRYS